MFNGKKISIKFTLEWKFSIGNNLNGISHHFIFRETTEAHQKANRYIKI